MLVITILPFAGLIAAVTLLWNEAVGWTDLALFFGLYLICGFGITIGYHRMLTHRAFEAVAPLKAALLVAGSFALQGSALDWAIDHRTHHAHSDKEGDPHSPHHGFGARPARRHQGPSARAHGLDLPAQPPRTRSATGRTSSRTG